MAGNCQDNSKLQIPLPEICVTPNIGCVPATSGVPTTFPRQDQIPFAYDQANKTLYLFDCATNSWKAITRFSLCELGLVSLENVNNICNVLNIPVVYSAAGVCVEGKITLADLAAELWKCWTWDDDVSEFKAVCVNTDTLKLNIVEGDTSLDVFFKFENLELVCGDGSATNPVVIRGLPQLCEYPTLSQPQVDAATTVFLGACVDGEEAKIPVPAKLCEYPTLTQNQVTASNDVRVAACVDGEEKLIPHINPCTLTNVGEILPTDEVTVCRNGSPCSVNINKFDPCDIPFMGSMLDTDNILACRNGVPIHVSTPVAVPETALPCVSLTNGKPTDVPGEQDSRFRYDCDGSLWFWTCDSYWEHLSLTPPELEALEPNLVNDICNELKLYSWYDGGDCLTAREVTPAQMSQILIECFPANLVSVHYGDITNNHWITFNEITGRFELTEFVCPPVGKDIEFVEDPTDGSQLISDQNVWTCPTDPADTTKTIEQRRLVIPSQPIVAIGGINGAKIGGGVCVYVRAQGMVINSSAHFRSRDGAIVDNNGNPTGGLVAPIPGTSGPLVGTFTNPFNVPALLQVHVTATASVLDYLDPSQWTRDMTFAFSRNQFQPIPEPNNIFDTNSVVVISIPMLNTSARSELTTGIYAGDETGSSILQFVVPALDSITIYGQWWYALKNVSVVGGNMVFNTGIHGVMSMRETWIKSAITI